MNKLFLGIITGFVLLLATLSINYSLPNLPMTLIVRNDQPAANADYILLMMGNVTDRTPHAAEILKQGMAKKIIFAEAEETSMIRMGYRYRDGQATYSYLRKLGVPKEQIVFLDKSRNTSSIEEVTYILQHIQNTDPQAKRIIMVTSWYHSSRATWIINRINDGPITIESFPSPSPESWWKKEGDFLNVFNEYLKWAYYLAKY